MTKYFSNGGKLIPVIIITFYFRADLQMTFLDLGVLNVLKVGFYEWIFLKSRK